MIRVTALRVAPVKGLASVSRQEVRIDVHGVADDRRLFLLDDRGMVVTMRTHPELVQVVPEVDLRAGSVELTLPGGPTASSPLGAAGERIRSRLFGKDRPGRIVNGDAAALLSEIAGERVRLILADGPGTGWDEGPVSLIGRSSVQAVGGPDRDAARYRMLVELGGTEPYAEDDWVGRVVAVDEATVQVTHVLRRCGVIDRSPVNGERDWDGLRAITDVRGQSRPSLGVIADVLAAGRVRADARVHVGI